MKVILNKDYKGLGKKNDVKEVNEGYARNFLIPSGIVMIATDDLVEKIKTQRQNISIMKDVKDDLLNRNLKEIEGKIITLQKNANEKGHLFSAISAKEVKDRMKKENKIEIEEDSIFFENPIKSLGEHKVSVRVKGKSVDFVVVIIK